MNNEENINPNSESLTEGNGVSNVNGPAVGGESVETKATTKADVSQPEALSLKELSNYLGKDFPTKEAALKSLKDTFSYVGMKKEDIAKEIGQQKATDDFAKELKELKNEMFYKDNPEYKDYRKLIEKMGGNPTEVVNSEEFKQIFTEAKGFRESQKLKTVLSSNPRIQASQDKLSQAREASKVSGERAAELAAQAIMETWK